jgi:two-component system response regulator PilR (NtrC family)
MAHLLIVDDERSICELLEISFRKEGHKVEVAASGEVAKRRLASQIFDVVVSDICLPDMDGVELLRYCKEISSEPTVTSSRATVCSTNSVLRFSKLSKISP